MFNKQYVKKLFLLYAKSQWDSVTGLPDIPPFFWITPTGRLIAVKNKDKVTDRIIDQGFTSPKKAFLSGCLFIVNSKEFFSISYVNYRLTKTSWATVSELLRWHLKEERPFSFITMNHNLKIIYSDVLNDKNVITKYWNKSKP